MPIVLTWRWFIFVWWHYWWIIVISFCFLLLTWEVPSPWCSLPSGHLFLPSGSLMLLCCLFWWRWVRCVPWIFWCTSHSDPQFPSLSSGFHPSEWWDLLPVRKFSSLSFSFPPRSFWYSSRWSLVRLVGPRFRPSSCAHWFRCRW